MEIRPVIDWLNQNNFDHTDVLITGVGLLATTYSLAKQVGSKKPDLILQAGIAGAFDKTIPLGSVKIVRHDIIGDLGVEELGAFRSVFSLQLADEDSFPFAGGRLTASDHWILKSGIPFADGISVNEISTTKKRMDYYTLTLGAAIETMEGAACHYVGLMERIPFLQLRAVSNYAGERDKNLWELDLAITNLNTTLIHLIKKMIYET
jgi:futalosine hydrolase